MITWQQSACLQLQPSQMAYNDSVISVKAIPAVLLCCRASVEKDGLVDDSRIGVPKTPISPAGPTASDLRLSKSLEDTLKSFNMFESDEGMQARSMLLMLHLCSTYW